MKRNRKSLKPFTRISRRALGLGLVLSVLFLQQSFAAALCLCDHETPHFAFSQCEQQDAIPTEAHDTGMHGETPAEMHHAGMHHEKSEVHESSPSSEAATVTAGQVGGGSPPSAFSCCHGRPQADVPAASMSVQTPVAVEETTPLTISDARATFISSRVSIPPRSRPIYLSLSCFLI